MIEFIQSAPFVLSAIIVIAISIAVLLEFEKEGWATTLFSIGTALTIWTYKADILGFVMEHTTQVICFSLAYILAGLVWSLLKWKNYVGKKVDNYEELKTEFTKKMGPVKENWKEWVNALQSNLPGFFYESDSPDTIALKVIPQAKEKKSLIVSWISYWPMSFGATLLNNPVRRFFEFIYSLVSGIYDKIAASAANRIASGIEKPEPKKKKELLNS
jgi:hypothetical protein